MPSLKIGDIMTMLDQIIHENPDYLTNFDPSEMNNSAVELQKKSKFLSWYTF